MLAEAAVIRRGIQKWDERPLLRWWLGRGEPSIPIQCYESSTAKVANGGCRTPFSWWTSWPHTQTEKSRKLALRERYRDHYMLA